MRMLASALDSGARPDRLIPCPLPLPLTTLSHFGILSLFSPSLFTDPNRRQIDVQELLAGYDLGRWRRRPAWLLRAGRPLDPAMQET
jgi:hypothetical protein